MRRTQVRADEKRFIYDNKSYDKSYYIYRIKLRSAPSWFKKTYGVGTKEFKKFKAFKMWHSRLRAAGLRMGVQVEKNLVLYDDREWAVIREKWEGRK